MKSKSLLEDKNIIKIQDVNGRDIKRIYTKKFVIFNIFYDTWNMDLSQLDTSEYIIDTNELLKDLMN